MLSKEGLDFLLHVTHWFGGHWEDPDWGRHPVTQMMVALAIRELAAGVEEAGARSRIEAAADEAITRSAQQRLKER